MLKVFTAAARRASASSDNAANKRLGALSVKALRASCSRPLRMGWRNVLLRSCSEMIVTNALAIIARLGVHSEELGAN